MKKSRRHWDRRYGWTATGQASPFVYPNWTMTGQATTFVYPNFLARKCIGNAPCPTTPFDEPALYTGLIQESDVIRVFPAKAVNAFTSQSGPGFSYRQNLSAADPQTYWDGIVGPRSWDGGFEVDVIAIGNMTNRRVLNYRPGEGRVRMWAPRNEIATVWRGGGANYNLSTQLFDPVSIVVAPMTTVPATPAPSAPATAAACAELEGRIQRAIAMGQAPAIVNALRGLYARQRCDVSCADLDDRIARAIAMGQAPAIINALRSLRASKRCP